MEIWDQNSQPNKSYEQSKRRGVFLGHPIYKVTVQWCRRDWLCESNGRGLMVKGWETRSTASTELKSSRQDLWSRSIDPGLILNTDGHSWLGCGVPFILARSSQNWNGNTGGPQCVCTPHMQSKVPPLPLQKSSRRTWVWHGLSTIPSAVF